MTEVFDTYTKRTKAYYIALLILVVPILLLALTNIFSGLQLSHEHTRYLGGSCAFGLAVYLFLNNCFIKMYIVDGKISFLNNVITTNSLTIPLQEIKKIVIVANDYEGKRRGTSNGSGNRIEIHDQYNAVHVYRFVVKSYIESYNLKKILNHYTESGLIVTSNGF